MKKQYSAPESTTVAFFTEGNVANLNLDSKNGATVVRSNGKELDDTDWEDFEDEEY